MKARHASQIAPLFIPAFISSLLSLFCFLEEAASIRHGRYDSLALALASTDRYRPCEYLCVRVHSHGSIESRLLSEREIHGRSSFFYSAACSSPGSRLRHSRSQRQHAFRCKRFFKQKTHGHCPRCDNETHGNGHLLARVWRFWRWMGTSGGAVFTTSAPCQVYLSKCPTTTHHGKRRDVNTCLVRSRCSRDLNQAGAGRKGDATVATKGHGHCERGDRAERDPSQQDRCWRILSGLRVESAHRLDVGSQVCRGSWIERIHAIAGKDHGAGD